MQTEPQFRYYAAVMVGAAPMGIPINANEPLTTAERIIRCATEIRRTLMQQSRSVNYPNVVILNLIPCREPGVTIGS